MPKTLLSSALPRRLFSVMVAALFGLTLALNPISSPAANAAVSTRVGVTALRIAASEIGVPYKWGGTRPWTGFDCSGLTQFSYNRTGRNLPRTAQQQYNATIHISWYARRVGDLVFFYTGRNVYHVGIYAGNWYMIDAPHSGARVRKERIWSSHVIFGRVR